MMINENTQQIPARDRHCFVVLGGNIKNEYATREIERNIRSAGIKLR